MEGYVYDVYKNKNSFLLEKFSLHDIGKAQEYTGEYADKMLLVWNNRLATLEDNLKRSFTDRVWVCKDNIKALSFKLLEKLRELEQNFYDSSIQSDNVVSKEFIEEWLATIRQWKKKVIDIKCNLKIYLTEMIDKHCDFLTNLDQFHPQYIKWKISRMIMEINEIILANEEAVESTELSLIRSASIFLKKKQSKRRKTGSIETKQEEQEEHDVINVNYDEMELEEERKRRRGSLLIEPMEELRTDTTLATMEEWMTKLRTSLNEPLPTFSNYDYWNNALQTAIDHVENCKNTVVHSAAEFINLVEPHLRDEILSMAQPKIELLNPQDKKSIERWMECLSFFDFSLKMTRSLIKAVASTWNQHVCRLETVRKLIQKQLRRLMVKQSQQQMRVELKINILLDSIREASSRSEIDANVKNIYKHFTDLEKVYTRTYENGLEDVKEFSVGCRLARKVFCHQAALCLVDESKPIEFPGHGSELDVTFDPIMELHHWEVIKQSYKSYANWHQGLVEGMNLLCQVEKEKEVWEHLWEEGLSRHLGWIKNVKEQALNRRKERLEADLVMPRIRELEAHAATLESHILGLDQIFAERINWMNQFKCTLLTMASKLQQEYDAIISGRNLNDAYTRNKSLGRINKFEIDLQKTDEAKTLLLETEIQKIRKKFAWLQKANHKILTCVRLFSEGGSFSTTEALEFGLSIKKLQSSIAAEEKVSLDTFINVAKGINPTKGIDVHVLSGIKQMIHYRTKKDSVEELVDTIMEKVKEAVKVELTSARDMSDQVCNSVKSTQRSLSLVLFAKLSTYLKLPPESTQLECEDIVYMTELMEERVPSAGDRRFQDEKTTDEVQSVEKVEQHMTCKQLLAEAALADAERDDGKRKRSAKASDLQADLHNIDFSVERKDVLRDTKCEQLKRLDRIKQMVEQGVDITNSDSHRRRKSNKIGGQDKTRSKRKSSRPDKKHTSGKEDDALGRDDGDLPPDINGDFLFKYTQLPAELSTPNFLLKSKKILLDHFVQILQISEKFFLSQQSPEIRKVWHEYSPGGDFRTLIGRVVKTFRTLNIHCEHNWLLLAHDLVCMIRALHCVTEEMIRDELESMECRWRKDFSLVCCESEAALKHTVQVKTQRASQLLGKFAFTTCEESECDSLQQELSSHCSQHVDDIKLIWSDYTKSLSETYLGYKKDFADFIKHTEDTRKALSTEKSVRAFLRNIQGFSVRYEKGIKIFLDKELLGADNELMQTEQNNKKTSHLDKLKRVQLLLKVILTVIENFEKNYIRKKVKADDPTQITDASEALSTKKVDIQTKKHLFLQDIMKNIKFKHGCFRRLCIDQICITVKWVDNWQKNSL